MHEESLQDLIELKDSAKEYFKTAAELEKIRLIEKSTKLGPYVLKIFVTVFFSVIIICCLLSALAVWYGKTTGNYLIGVLISGGGLVFLAVILILLRKKLVINSLISTLSKILLSDDNIK
jgi:hypothetical protein